MPRASPDRRNLEHLEVACSVLTAAAMALITTESAHTVIGCAIEVHRKLGPGLFESVYQPCLAHEFRKAGLQFEEQVIVPLDYDGLRFDRAFRADFIVNSELIVEPTSVSPSPSVSPCVRETPWANPFPVGTLTAAWSWRRANVLATMK
jgi:GxxExxY protein